MSRSAISPWSGVKNQNNGHATTSSLTCSRTHHARGHPGEHLRRSPTTPMWPSRCASSTACPVSDGGAAVILLTTEDEGPSQLGRPLVKLTGIGQATDTLAVFEREDPTELQRGAPIGCRLAFDDGRPRHRGTSMWPSSTMHSRSSRSPRAKRSDFSQRVRATWRLEKGETEHSAASCRSTHRSVASRAAGHPVGATGVSLRPTGDRHPAARRSRCDRQVEADAGRRLHLQLRRVR